MGSIAKAESTQPIERKIRTRSDGRCCTMAADAPRRALECSVGLFDGDNEDLGPGLEICLLSQLVNDDGRGRHEDLLLAVLVFQVGVRPLAPTKSTFGFVIVLCGRRSHG